MLKSVLSLAVLSSISLSVNASFIQINDNIQDHGVYTRDVSSGLDWLDVTETRGMSYNQVQDQMGVGDIYEGWRYATYSELDTLILDFGYTPSTSSCLHGNLVCDYLEGGDSQLVELMIMTLGDTQDAHFDEVSLFQDHSTSGAGLTYGLLSTQVSRSGYQDVGVIFDQENIYRDSGKEYIDSPDSLLSIGMNSSQDSINPLIGSFLVRATEVPEPATLSLLSIGLIGLGFARKRQCK